MFASLLLARLASAETDELGGSDVDNNLGDMMKLVVLDVEEAAVLTLVEFAVENRRGSDGDVIMVLYRDNGAGRFELVEALDATGLPAEGEGWASSGQVAWVLEPGDTIAVGVWIASDWVYFYTTDGTDFPWFGDVAGTFRVEEDVPASFSSELEEYYYRMRLTSEDADVDGDGAVAETWGGTDCDDAAADVNPSGQETPYDGVDQDCSGADLADVDADGEDAVEAGGGDCDDGDALIGSFATDACGDAIDQDCSGADLSCDEGDEGGGDDDGRIDASPKGGCGCATGGEPALIAAALSLAALARRRRAA